MALRGVRISEGQLLDAAHRSELASKIASIIGAFASLLAAAEARIIAHAQGKIALIDPALSPAERFAAIARLQGEQEAALVILRRDIALERKQQQRAATATLRSRHRSRLRDLSHRHSGERLAAATYHDSRAHVLPKQRHRPMRAIRRIAAGLVTRRFKRIASISPKR